MTQPNAYTPDSAANYDSLADWAAKTQAERELELNAPEETRWGNINTGLDAMKDNTSNAQDSANFANAVLGSGLQSNVDGGIRVSDSMSGLASTTLGAGYTMRSTGSGAGTFGRNGLGKAVWTLSGGLERAHYYRHVTELGGDYQVVQHLMTTRPDPPGVFEFNPANWLLGRVSADLLTFVYARVAWGELSVGCFDSGTQHVFTTFSTDVQPGQVWRLQCGADNGTTPDEFVVYRNSTEVWRGSDGGYSSYGSSYLGVGLAASAASHFFATTQTIPAAIDMWAAADYTAA